ncbi:hypothetical protein [Brytella acorum]|uniref:Uncharacterized protein n=1 Tax=Brytella acorum TaxID=2959299 RepID=A0AA35UZN0_9PROT|nr:hypothetical protein [Brytella acorum]CAI9122428.1 hypothetical protein LMG32879_003295 [Brytella acorum]
MCNIKKFVIFKTPRNPPLIGFLFIFLLSISVFFMEYYIIIPDLFSLNGINKIVKFDSSTVKLIGGFFIIFFSIAVAIAAIRNNTKSQPVETSIIIFSFIWFAFFVFFSTPLTFLWAHIHGYHYDHYEAARRGGWYIFRLNGT